MDAHHADVAFVQWSFFHVHVQDICARRWYLNSKARTIELDFEVNRANKEKPPSVEAGGATLLPASETTRKEEAPAATGSESEKKPAELDVSAVFAKLKQLGGDKKGGDEQ